MIANKVRQETGGSEDISQGQRMTESNDTGMHPFYSANVIVLLLYVFNFR